MRVLLDTNLLTRASQPGHAQHGIATRSIARLVDREESLCLVPQNLYEFWVVCTRPVGENGLGMTPELAYARLNDLKQAFEIFDEVPAFRRQWEDLVVRYDVKGKSAHDARLVAAMAVYGVTTILTFNAQHFTRYPGLTVLTPADVLAVRE